MRCPVCDETLREVEKFGVAIDICPGCKGVWLDRGELEKIIDMANTGGPVGEARNGINTHDHVIDERRRSDREHDDHKHDRDHDKCGYDEHGHGDSYSQKKRRGSWLSDILGGFGED